MRRLVSGLLTLSTLATMTTCAFASSSNDQIKSEAAAKNMLMNTNTIVKKPEQKKSGMSKGEKIVLYTAGAIVVVAAAVGVTTIVVNKLNDNKIKEAEAKAEKAVREAEALIREAEAKGREARKEMEKARQERSALESKRLDLDTKIKQYESKIKEMQEQYEKDLKLAANNDALNAQIKGNERKLKELDEQLSAAKMANQSLKEQVEKLDDEKATLEENISKLTVENERYLKMYSQARATKEDIVRTGAVKVSEKDDIGTVLEKANILQKALKDQKVLTNDALDAYRKEYEKRVGYEQAFENIEIVGKNGKKLDKAEIKVCNQEIENFKKNAEGLLPGLYSEARANHNGTKVGQKYVGTAYENLDELLKDHVAKEIKYNKTNNSLACWEIKDSVLKADIAKLKK